jgi:hypothetical protein
MFVKKITVSASSEIRRPRTYVFGGLVIGLALLAHFLSGMFVADVQQGRVSTGWLLSYVIPIVLIFVSIPFLKQSK